MLDYLLYKFKEQFKFESEQDKSDKIIQSAVNWSMGAGLIPLVGVDMIAVTAIQAMMVRQLAEVYKVDYEEANIKSWLTSLSGGVISGAIKIIPGVGQVIGGISMAIIAGASTYASGKTFVKHFEAGGTFEDFDVETFTNYYKEEFEKGKGLVGSLQDEISKRGKKFYKDYVEWEEVDEDDSEIHSDNTQASSKENYSNSKAEPASDDVFERLKQLISLKEEGVLSEDEFEILKKKLMKDL